MKKNPLVSVIVNCFNSEKTILRAINSILNQTFTNFEIIVWDNDSSDSTRNLISSLDDNRIKLFKSNKTVPLGIARNFAINEAKGKYVAFLDSDDLWNPKKLEKQLSFMCENDIAFSYTNYQFMSENGANLSNIILAPKKMTYDSDSFLTAKFLPFKFHN